MEDGRRSALSERIKACPKSRMPVPASQRMNPSPPPISTQEVFPRSSPDGERKLLVDKSPDLLIGRKITRPGCPDRPEDLLADLSCCRRRGQRSARPPEMDVHPLHLPGKAACGASPLHHSPRCTPANMLTGSCFEPGLRTHLPLSAGQEMDPLFLEFRIKPTRCQPSKRAPPRHPIPRIGNRPDLPAHEEAMWNFCLENIVRL